MDRLFTSLRESLQLLEGDVRTLLIATAFIMGGCWLGHHLLMIAIWRRTEDAATRYRWRKTSGYTWFALTLILLGFLWFDALGSLGTFVGLVSAGVTIALRDAVANVAGWLFLVARRPFEVGDRIQLGEHKGDVVDINVFHFSLLEIGNWVDADQSTGRIIQVPNGQVMTEAFANYSKGFHYIWHEVPVLVTFESNWTKAKEILLGIANRVAKEASTEAREHVRQAARRFMVRYQNLTPIVYVAVRDSGVLLTMRYLCEPRRRRGTEAEVWEAILNAFDAESDIGFAYPTGRFHMTSETPVAPAGPVDEQEETR